MPSKEKHLDLYQRNMNLSDTPLMSKKENLDWKLTMKYYSIVHLMDSTYTDVVKTETQFPHPNNHTERKQQIENTHGENTKMIYIALENLSRKSRYKCISITNRDIEQAESIIKTIKNKLKIS